MWRWVAIGVFSILTEYLAASVVYTVFRGTGYGVGAIVAAVTLGLPLGSVAGAGILGTWLLRFSLPTLLKGTVLAFGLSEAWAILGYFVGGALQPRGWPLGPLGVLGLLLPFFGLCFGSLAGYAIAKNRATGSPTPVA